MEEMEKNDQGTLYIVATPIGNLADMTFRGVSTLESVDVIACEDTRVTGKLLAHYDITTPKVAIHQHSSASALEQIVKRLTSGESVAYVSDAGTPGVSDPGNQLVASAREAGVHIVPIPGVSAVAAAVSIAGIDMQTFLFMAYPPHKKGRDTFFTKVVAAERPVVYYDSVHRIVKNLHMLAEKNPGCHIIVGRELTKMFEQIQAGAIEDVIAYFESHPGKVKGEFVVIAS